MLNPLNLFSKLFKSHNQKELDRLEKIVVKINQLEPNIKKLQDKDFPIKTIEFKERIKKGESLNDLIPEVYIGSADWMRRNLDRRVEAVTPIEDSTLKKQLGSILEIYLNDHHYF